MKILKGKPETEEEHTSQWSKEKSTKGQTMIYKTLAEKNKDRTVFLRNHMSGVLEI